MTQNKTKSIGYKARVGTTLPPNLNVPPAFMNDMVLNESETNEVQPGIKEQLQAMSSEFDNHIVILGSGPAGYVAAIRAAQLGARVAIVEKGSVGGTCLNVGCIPTKALLSSVAVLDHVKHGEDFGIKVKDYELDIPTMMKHKDKVVKQLVSGVEGLFRKNNVKLIRGVGKLTDAHTVTVETENGTETVQGDKILIASGSVPAVLPIPGLEIGENVWSSTEALSFSEVPKSMLIIGAGAIGLESGYTFARMGTDVLVVEMMPQILPAADTETANTLQKSLEKAGMKFMLNATVSAAEDVNDGKKVTIKIGDGEQSHTFEKVLVAVGRRAVLQGIGLDEVGVKYDKRKILVNEHMQTNIPNIYAAGDVIGEPMLAHVGWTESQVAVEHALGINSRMDYRAFPACVYTTPECSSVGLTEEQARERYNDVKIGKFTFNHNGKALGMREAEGFVKFVTREKYGEILGVHMVGPHVTDLIAEAVLAVRNELTLDEVIATMHPHPTLSEVVGEAAMDAADRPLHK